MSREERATEEIDGKESGVLMKIQGSMARNQGNDGRVSGLLMNKHVAKINDDLILIFVPSQQAR